MWDSEDSTLSKWLALEGVLIVDLIVGRRDPTDISSGTYFSYGLVYSRTILRLKVTSLKWYRDLIDNRTRKLRGLTYWRDQLHCGASVSVCEDRILPWRTQSGSTCDVPSTLGREVAFLVHTWHQLTLDHVSYSWEWNGQGIVPDRRARDVQANLFSICIIWGLHCSNHEECRLLLYKNQVPTPQETHFVSTTEHNRLMLCKIWGFHGGDYEECRLLGYKTSVRTSQEIYYLSTTEHSRLILYKSWGFHGGDYE
jgi:hypothetical protein